MEALRRAVKPSWRRVFGLQPWQQQSLNSFGLAPEQDPIFLTGSHVKWTEAMRYVILGVAAVMAMTNFLRSPTGDKMRAHWRAESDYHALAYQNADDAGR